MGRHESFFRVQHKIYIIASAYDGSKSRPVYKVLAIHWKNIEASYIAI